VFVLGMAMAIWYRRTDGERYAGIGRYLHDDV